MSLFAVAKLRSTIGATLLITDCRIGAAIVGLPVMSALAGLMPSMLAMILDYKNKLRTSI